MHGNDAVSKLGNRLGREVASKCMPRDMEAAARIIADNLGDFLLMGCEYGRGAEELRQEWPDLVKRCVLQIKAINGGHNGRSQ